MKRFKNGHPVLYRMYTNNVKYTIKEIKKDGITGKRSKFEKDVVLIEGFVVGDTKKHGLSIVALEKTDLCLAMIKSPTKKDREMISHGYLDSKINGEKILGNSTPICKYS